MKVFTLAVFNNYLLVVCRVIPFIAGDKVFVIGILFKKKISKSQRLSNWEAKTLRPSQQMYAAIDAWACLKIHNELIKNGAPQK